MVDGYAERCADLVLTPVAPPDRSRLIVGDREVALQILAHRLYLLGLPALAQQRKDGSLDRREPRIQAHHDPLFVLHDVLVVRLEQKGQHRAIDAQRRLDYPGAITLAGLLVEIGQIPAAMLRVLIEIVAAALRDALQLAPSKRVEILEIGGAARVMRQLLGPVRAHPQMLARHPVLQKPVVAKLDPEVEPT